MAETTSEVKILISGSAVGLTEALKQAQAGLVAFGGSAHEAGSQAGEHLAAGEHKAAEQATLLGERARVAAEMVSLMGAESSEQILKIEGLNHAFGEAQHAFGGFSGALVATAGSFALFRGLDFLHESVDEAEQGQAAWARLSAAYAGNADALEQVKSQIESTSESWAALGLNQAQVADLAARAAGMGLDVKRMLGDPQAIADIAAVLKTDIPSALDAIARPRGAQQVLSRLGLSPVQIKEATARMRDMNAQQRALFIEQQVEQSRFKGMGTAFEQTDAGKLLKFHTMMQNLQEEVGTALLPAILQLVEAMTSLLQGAEKAAQPFGGLANVLKTLFLPMLGLGLLLFTNLRGMMTRLVDLLLSRLVGAFSQTAEAMAEADGEARTLADDLNSIPALVATTATFVPATAVKDAYRANIYSIPTAVTTTAAFEEAAVPEPTVTPVEVPVVYRGTLTEAKPHPLTVPVRYVGGALKTGLAFGAGVAIADAVFNSVTIKHVTLPPQPTPRIVPTSTAASTAAPAGVVTIRGTPHVYVTNLGSLGSALTSASRQTPQPSGQPSRGTATGATQTVRLTGVPTVKLDRTTPIQGTLALPSTLNVHARQSGSWTVNLAPDAFARFGQMIGEIALGTMIGSALQGLIGKIPFGKIVDVLRGLFRRGGGKGGGGGTDTEPFDTASVLKQAQELVKGAAVAAPSPKGSTFVLTGLGNLGSAVGDAIKHIDWMGAFKAAGMAAAFAAGLVAMAAAAVVAFGGALGALFRPSEASAETVAEAKKAGLTDTQAKAYVQNSNKAILAAHEGMASSLGDLGGFIVDSIIDGVKHHWPSILPWLFGGERPKHGALYIGEHNYPEFVKAGSKVPGAPSGYQYVPTGKTDYPYRLEELIKGTPSPIPSSFSGRFGGLSRLDPALLTQASALIGASGAGGKAPAAAHHTYNATFNIHGATDANAVARQVNRAFSEFVQGARAQRRLHG